MSLTQPTDKVDLHRYKGPVKIVTQHGSILITPQDNSPFFEVTQSGHTYRDKLVNPDQDKVIRIDGRLEVVTPRPNSSVVTGTDGVEQIFILEETD